MELVPFAQFKAFPKEKKREALLNWREKYSNLEIIEGVGITQANLSYYVKKFELGRRGKNTEILSSGVEETAFSEEEKESQEGKSVTTASEEYLKQLVRSEVEEVHSTLKREFDGLAQILRMMTIKPQPHNTLESKKELGSELIALSYSGQFDSAQASSRLYKLASMIEGEINNFEIVVSIREIAAEGK